MPGIADHGRDLGSFTGWRGAGIKDIFIRLGIQKDRWYHARQTLLIDQPLEAQAMMRYHACRGALDNEPLFEPRQADKGDPLTRQGSKDSGGLTFERIDAYRRCLWL